MNTRNSIIISQNPFYQYMKIYTYKDSKTSSPPLFIISSDLHKKMMFFSRRSNNILQEETRFIPIKSCLPYLNKIYISPTGDIFMCSDLYYIKGFNIGNIDKSIELNKLQDIMTQYTNFRNKTCKKMLGL
ncbi:hypothetical protein DXA71_23035 [Parabacteroides distasonis]|nr:hypothetical protein DXA71_23035 [Parabacteroides distasonis]